MNHLGYKILTLLSIVSMVVQAQHTSIFGRFDIDYIKGCTGMTVTVSVNPNTPAWTGAQFWYEGLDSSSGEAPGSHTYTEPGEFYVVMLVTNDNVGKDSIRVEVLEPENPKFTIHNCDTHNVRVEIEDDYYDSYFVEFTNTDNEVVDPLGFSSAYDFGTQGNYRIDVSGRFKNSFNATCGVNNKAINTIDAIINPILQSVTTTTESLSGEIALGLDLAPDIIYNLESSTDGTENYELVSIVSDAIETISDLNTQDQFYCYRINTYDACKERTILSDVICSVYFDVEGTEQANTISWQTDTVEVVSYNIIRDNSLLINITNSSTISYDDGDVICNESYVYNVQPIFDVGPPEKSSVSVDTAVVASKSENLPAVGLPYSSVNSDNDVELTWGPPDTGAIPFRRYIIEKNIRDRSWRYLDASGDSPNDTTYVDTEANFIGQHAYRIVYDDDCGNLATPSPSTIPIIIEQGVIRGKEVIFNWNKYETWINGIRNYTIERVDEETGIMIEEFPVFSGREVAIEFSANDSGNKFIRVRAESLDPIPQYTYSNIILTELTTSMFLPNVFTPDDDGMNDRFVAKGPKVFNFKMELYSRWGELIFTTNDNFNGWDGRINDKDAPEATYIYKIYFEDAEGNDFDQSGSVLLMRKG